MATTRIQQSPTSTAIEQAEQHIEAGIRYAKSSGNDFAEMKLRAARWFLALDYHDAAELYVRGDLGDVINIMFGLETDKPHSEQQRDAMASIAQMNNAADLEFSMLREELK